MSHSNFHSLRRDNVIRPSLQIDGPNILPEASHQREWDGMFDNCIGDEKGEFPNLHQIGQQESVFGSKRDWIEHIGFDAQPGASNGESSRVQVPNASIWLEHEALKGCEP